MNEVRRGDCLEVLADLPAGSVDLMYADPPYGTGKDWGAFDDRWQNGLDGYLKWMRPRLEAVRRALAETGSLYLHCDPTASHYLKVMCDQVFGRDRFRNEVVWSYRRWSAKSAGFQRTHDILLFYAGEGATWNSPTEPKADGTPKFRRWNEPDPDKPGRFRTRCDRQQEVLETAMRDVWEIGRLQSDARERVGYPTQKPVALLDRVVLASSNQGDLVCDPFCGSGTTLVAAKRLGRRWWGCDLNPQAVTLTERRLAAETAPLPGMAGG